MSNLSFPRLKPRFLHGLAPFVSSRGPRMEFSCLFQLLDLHSLAHGSFSIIKASSTISSGLFLLHWSNSFL